MFEENNTFILNEGITYTEIEDNGRKETVFYHGENEHYYSLNAMGTEIFNRILEGKSIGEIIDFIMENYKVTNREIVKNDVIDLIKDLVEEKIISKNE